MSIDPILTEELLLGCQHLEVLDGYEQKQELYWYKELERWVLHFNVTESYINPESNISKMTQWYMLIDPLYPRGSIGVYPDKVNSVQESYPHQNDNIETDDYPWRWGRVCTDWDNSELDLLSDNEEFLDAKQRLFWHVQRLKLWLVSASNHTLMEPGDVFELPHIHYRNEDKVVFAEVTLHFDKWLNLSSRSGSVFLQKISKFPNIIFVSDFFNRKSEVIQEYDWGNEVSLNLEKQSYYGVWLLLKFQPIKNPWAYPKTFRELEVLCSSNKVDLWEEIYDLMHVFRDNDRNFILLGFPIPKIVGQENQIIQWITYEIPKLSKLVKKIKGFRKSKDMYFNIDRLNHLKPSKELNYLCTENWSKEAILSRGSLDLNSQQGRVFLIGAGALGSAIGELLCRTGVSQITVCDNDKLQIGNLSRHILGLDDLDEYKSVSLSKRINQNNLHIKSTGITNPFPDLSEEEIEEMDAHDVIIDTTGSDMVINQLNSFGWTLPKRFISVSLGFGAKRIFIFLSNKHPFPNETFFKYLQPWLVLEKQENEDISLPREGIGCYHPLFPARLDDIWTMAGLAIKEIEIWWPNMFGSNVFAVYEQQQINGMPTGVLLKQREVF
ncbi:ThiF family adenylyltransferase [Paenibacillus taichungensis]|uniref:ThiF family adenylyltransferase n=1 Tax=Paenibacillus taichungensis TaxID=484184 RepID=UPI0028718170|nr:ThiF family adenylyltransferase [Paenibacillus taichungensis]MDR9748535.1 ThiF family adenylyltransferase [Paenibacillus taichungensis]